MAQDSFYERKITRRTRSTISRENKAHSDPAQPGNPAANSIQQKIGNRVLQRVLAQRNGDGSFDLDDQTTARINQFRGGGQPLDSTVQAQTGAAMGADFSSVRVHTTPEADALNQQLNAKAFTTGQDIFFSEGAYQPGSSSGQELMAHELTHVVQQSSGAVGGSGGRMTVNAPGDAFEQQADAAAREMGQASSTPLVQRQKQVEEEEEPVQAKALQRQEQPEEEDESVQAKALQRQEQPEEEEELR